MAASALVQTFVGEPDVTRTKRLPPNARSLKGVVEVTPGAERAVQVAPLSLDELRVVAKKPTEVPPPVTMSAKPLSEERLAGVVTVQEMPSALRAT